MPTCPKCQTNLRPGKLEGSDEKMLCCAYHGVIGPLEPKKPRGSAELESALNVLMKPTGASPSIVEPPAPPVEEGWITLPYPPRINAMYRNVTGVGRALTTATKDWKSEAADILSIIKVKPYTEGEVEVHIRFYRRRKAGDIDGCIKAVLDALKGYVIEDDEQVSRLVVERFLDRDRPRAEVRVKAVLRAAGGGEG